ncbi:hypothetical protein KJ632_02370, partial [Patescibacteria group bacterium]|nr:hypothetical protein [Patescibacteria group bacterium]
MHTRNARADIDSMPAPAKLNNGAVDLAAVTSGDDVLITVDEDNLRHILIIDKAQAVCSNNTDLAHIYESDADTWTGECLATDPTAYPGAIQYFEIDAD